MLPFAQTFCDAETPSESLFCTQVRELQKKMQQQEREPKRARTHSSAFDSFETSRKAQLRCGSPPTLPIWTRATGIESACYGLQLDFASLRVEDARPMSADGVGTEGVLTGQKVPIFPFGDGAYSARLDCAHIRANRAQNCFPPKPKVSSYTLPTPPPPWIIAENVATRDLAGTSLALPGQDKPRVTKGSFNHNDTMNIDALPRDAQGLPMWPRFEGPVRFVAESESDWSDEE